MPLKKRINLKEKLAETGVILGVIAIGFLQFGWIFWPELGFYLSLINTIIIVGILVAGITWRVIKKTKGISS